MRITSSQPLDLAKLEAFERRHDVRLPEDYRRFLLAHDGGRPTPDRLQVTDRSGATGVRIVDRLFGIEHGDGDSLSDWLATYRSRLLPGWVPIGRNAGGDLFCLDTSSATATPVYFWDHEGEADRAAGEVPGHANVLRLADTFAAFMARLS